VCPDLCAYRRPTIRWIASYPMKKVPKSLSKNYLPVKLYLDDLENIEDILKATDSYSLRTDDYQYESVNELVTNVKTDRLRQLDIGTLGVSINLGKISAAVHVSSNAANNAGTFYELDQILSRRTRLGKWSYSFPFMFILIPIVALLTSFLFLLHLSLRLNLAISIVLYVLAAAWMVWIYYVRIARHSLIILVHKGTQKGFFERNKDNLILVIISGLLGAILGVAGTLTVNYFVGK
jgi:hypothetical protein